MQNRKGVKMNLQKEIDKTFRKSVELRNLAFMTNDFKKQKEIREQQTKIYKKNLFLKNLQKELNKNEN